MGGHNPHYQIIGQMFQKDYRWLCAAVGRTLGCPHSAQDIASETFCGCWRCRTRRRSVSRVHS